jgi:hypothetical protein
MAKKQLSENLRIVCEGENTEPNYFKYLAKNTIAKEKWGRIEITPVPKEDNEPIDRAGTNTNRPKRAFSSILSFIPPPIHKAVPLRYVAEVLDDFNNGTYSEGWAVYDLNGHPKHAEAWELKGNQVNVALSARSFEHWILLHFEKNANPFIATECKCKVKSQKIPIGCGTTKPVDASSDCVKQGNIICLCGYLRHKYIPNYGKGLTKAEDMTHFQELMKVLENRLPLAFENAAWLRFKMQPQLAANANLPYLVNPYTNVDMLVKSILNISTEYIWAASNHTLKLAQNEEVIVKIDAQNIHIEYTGSFNLKEDDFKLRRLDCDINSNYNFACNIISNNRKKNIILTHELPTLANTVLVISRFVEKIIYFELF